MKCERCTIETNTHTVSMFNTQAICMDCKETEKGHPKYKEACRTEFEEVRKGNFNFEGIGWDGLTYEDTNKGITLCGMCGEDASICDESVNEATLQEIDKKVQKFIIKNANDYDYSNQDSAFQIYLSIKKLYPNLIK